MIRPHLGEFQELVLLVVMLLGEEAYGVSIQQELEAKTGRSLSRGALHTVLLRLEERGFVKSHMGGATTERGGRRKRYFSITPVGEKVIREVNGVRQSLWNSISTSS